jgi:hypothetical protein
MFNKSIKNLKKDKSLNKLSIKFMKLKELVEGSESLGVLMGQKLPIVLSFKLSLFVKKASPELEEYNKKRNELLTEYADTVNGEDGKPTGQMKFKGDEEQKQFNEKILALLDEEIKVEVPAVSIGEFAGISIEPRHLSGLDWLIKE